MKQLLLESEVDVAKRLRMLSEILARSWSHQLGSRNSVRSPVLD